MFGWWNWIVDKFGIAVSVAMLGQLALVFAPAIWGWPSVVSAIALALNMFGLLLYIAVRSAWIQMQPPRRSTIRKRAQRR